MKDLFGRAILDYQLGSTAPLMTATNISEEDEMPVSWLFRTYEEMPAIEKRALDLARGYVLDAGAGAGSHSLYLQDQRGLDVVALDISDSAAACCRQRGIRSVAQMDIMQYDGGPFDTILLMMNGTGLCGKLEKLGQFLGKMYGLLRTNGQVLIDSSDIIYMFDTDASGSVLVPDGSYYGELQFEISYKGDRDRFDWLYVDYPLLAEYAEKCGFESQLIMEGEHYDYLARLIKK